MNRRITTLLLALLCLLAPLLTVGAAAAAPPGGPSLRVHSARVVAHGAAVEVTYTVVCPDQGDALTSLNTNAQQQTKQGSASGRDSIELVCSGSRQRVTNLVAARSGAAAFQHHGALAVASELQNCSEDPSCFDVRRDSTLRAHGARFRAETNQNVDARLRLLSARLKRDGSAVTTRYALTCPEGDQAFLQSTVTQAVKRQVVGNGAVTDFDCTGTREVHRVVVPAPDGAQFRQGVSVVAAEVSDCNEPIGCFQGLSTSQVHLRRR